jgi:hypothetical protein
VQVSACTVIRSYVADFRSIFPLSVLSRISYHGCMNRHNHLFPSRDGPDQHGLGTHLSLRAFRRQTDEIGTAARGYKQKSPRTPRGTLLLYSRLLPPTPSWKRQCRHRSPSGCSRISSGTPSPPLSLQEACQSNRCRRFLDTPGLRRLSPLQSRARRCCGSVRSGHRHGEHSRAERRAVTSPPSRPREHRLVSTGGGLSPGRLLAHMVPTRR